MQAEYEIKLTRPTSEAVSVAWSTRNGTAIAGLDFHAATGSVTFAPGETRKTIEIEIMERDTPLERVFYVLLTGAVGAEIIDDEGKCTIRPIGVIGPLVKSGLVTNAYHNVEGRGGYFHEYAGTSEGQTIAIEAAMLAQQVLADHSPEASEWYKALGLTMLDAVGDGSLDGPMLRQPFPTGSSDFTLLHWLFAARGDVPAQAITYAYQATVQSGKLVVVAPGLYKVWAIYPATSQLLYESPYSPAYDIDSPAEDTRIEVDAVEYSDGRAVITVPDGVTGDWKVVYGAASGVTIAQGDAFEAYPSWTPIADGYAACAPDTFRWFDLAATLAIGVDDRPGMAAQWTNLRNALRRTSVKGQAITDLREVFKPVPGVPAIPFNSEPSGVFCYSDHPAATPPPAELPQSWSGYNFWSRETGGTILCTVPDAGQAYQVQIGRGKNDEWRIATDYQEADQYLWVSVSASVLMGLGEAYVYVSSTKNYDADTRWYADLGGMAAWSGVVAAFGAGNTVDLFIPRTSFLRKDSDDAVLPAGTRLENFGLSIEHDGAYQLRLGSMRLVSAATEAAKAGSVMPYFPGVMPFAINGDTVTSQFVGWNGSPFHGYQLPDFWLNLEMDAAAVHPDLSAGDLAVANIETGALEYPITATVGGQEKPVAALLMEQQLYFLKHAQEKWEADSGYVGPFAHTFVLNTDARASIGNPTPHTWVYTNDDPNTQWAGYQVRVVESLARAAWLARYKPGFQACRDMAGEMALIWLNWLASAWPDLSGTLSGGATIYGPPSDFPDPALSPVLTQAEDPHVAAIILRACLWLKQYNPTTTALCDALMARCWQYLELMWVEQGPMAYTWSPHPDQGEWFGFWHFEIIATLSALLIEPGRPASIPADKVLERLTLTYNWLKTTGVK